jgi:hypothetical protein
MLVKMTRFAQQFKIFSSLVNKFNTLWFTGCDLDTSGNSISESHAQRCALGLKFFFRPPFPVLPSFPSPPHSCIFPPFLSSYFSVFSRNFPVFIS